MKSNKITIISDKGNDFLKSKWSLIVFLGAIISLSIMNFTLFGMELNPVTTIFSDGAIWSYSDNAWMGWFEISVSSLGSFLTIFGVILTIRFDKRFIFPLVAGELLIICDSIMVGLIFTTLCYMLMLAAAFYNYFMWHKEDSEDSKTSTFMWIMLGIGFIAYMGFGSAVGYETWFYEGARPSKMWLDLICSGVVAASWFILLRKSKWGFLGFLVTDVIYIILYSQTGLLSIMGSYVVYMFIDGISFASWYNKN